MADPFTVLGTASSIVTLLELAWKLLAETHTVYKSTAGQSDESLFLSTIVKDVTRLNSNIVTSSECSDDLRDLVDNSRKIGEEVLGALNELQAKDTTVWKSFMVALKDVWRKGKIETFSQRLMRIQSRVASHIQQQIFNGVSDISKTIAIMEKRDDEIQTKILGEFQRLRDEVSSAARTVAPLNDRYELSLKELPKVGKHTEHFGGSFVSDMTQNLRTFSSTMNDFRVESKSASYILQILKSLYFPGITARQRKIPDAHARTFMWVYEKNLPDDNKRIHFVDWLKTEGGVFWIQGKPGSGKSTLMKFITLNDRTLACLQPWAAGKRIYIARFFFWNAGSTLQKSQEGLLRSLLFEILRQCPELGPRVSELRSEALRLHGGLENWDDAGPWTCDELLFVCCRIGTYAKDARFMLFIDGLDEYEEDRMAVSDLIETVRKLARAPNIKLCVSSRPWGVFLDAFGHDRHLTLKLEDLTRSDIRQYVADKFNKNHQYRRLRVLDPAYSDLVIEVCKRAHGVFLWVYLAVRDLLDGLTNADSVGLLSKRLDSYPPELEDFFQRMIDTIPEKYQTQSARIFDIARLAPEPQSMIAYSFVDEVEEHPDSIYQMETLPMKEAEIVLREDRLRRQLYARCRGLLEITSDEVQEECYYQLKIDFLHRTVSDFLRHSKKLNFLPDENLSAAVMSRALVAQVKSAPSFVLAHLSDDSGPMRLIENLVEFVSRMEPGDPGSNKAREILRVAESALKEHQSEHTPREMGVHGHQLATDSLKRPETIVGLVFIGRCCRKGLYPYVESRAHDPDIHSALEGLRPGSFPRARVYRPLLAYALECHNGFMPLDTIRVLLEQGADPNEIYNTSTVWSHFLFTWRVQSKLRYDSTTQKTIRLLVQHQADLSAGVRVHRDREHPTTSKEPELQTAWNVIKGIFSEVEQENILRALQRQATRGKWLPKVKGLFPKAPPEPVLGHRVMLKTGLTKNHGKGLLEYGIGKVAARNEI